MRKLLFAVAIMITGAFAFAAGAPAGAVTAGPVTGMADIVKSTASTENVHWRHRHWRHRHWRHRHWGYRRCWWHRGHRHCGGRW